MGRRTVVEDWAGTAVYYTDDGRGLSRRVHSPSGRAQSQSAVSTDTTTHRRSCAVGNPVA